MVRAFVPRRRLSAVGVILLLGGVYAGFFGSMPVTRAHAQQPTGSIPTVTGTPSGPLIRVDQSIPQVRVMPGRVRLITHL